MKIPPRSIDSGRGTPSRRRGRNHRADTLHVREDGTGGPQDYGEEENPPSEPRSPRPTGRRGRSARGSPEAADRERADVFGRGTRDRDDRIKEGEQRHPEDDEAEDQQAERRHRATVLHREEAEDDGEDDEEYEVEQVRGPEDARHRAGGRHGRRVG